MFRRPFFDDQRHSCRSLTIDLISNLAVGIQAGSFGVAPVAWEDRMKPASILAAHCISTLIGGYAEAQSAPKFKKADLIGTWMLVSVANTTDGKTVTTFGPGEGQLDFSP